MREETAKQLVDLLMRHTADLNEHLKTVQDAEPRDEFARIRLMIGKIMGSMYLDALHPIFEEYPDLKPADLR